MSTSWENLIEELSSLQHQFIKVVEQIEKPKRNNPGVCGSWSPKQVVAHITGWDKEVTRQFGLFQDGLKKAIEHDIDEFNKKSVQERNHLSWEETVAELQRAHEQFYQKAKSISSQDLSKKENTEIG
ncbi:MAG TPA: ClbS/DfsB family four-helix bundle protein [Balneolaceae bacterium]